MGLNVSISTARWWFLNGHLMRDCEAVSANGLVRWRQWRCIFCGRPSHCL
jgi:hypothetical protein